jgi:hypothetical protein
MISDQVGNPAAETLKGRRYGKFKRKSQESVKSSCIATLLTEKCSSEALDSAVIVPQIISSP